MGMPLDDARQCLDVDMTHDGHGYRGGDEVSESSDDGVALLRNSHLFSERSVPDGGLELGDEAN